MALQSSGKISASDINTELTRASNASFRMGDAEERALAGVPSGSIRMSDFYGKSSYTPVITNPVKRTFYGTQTSKATHSFSASIGAASSKRWVAVLITNSANNTVSASSVTIGGITATFRQVQFIAGGNRQGSVIAWAKIPTGSSATIAAAFSGNADNFGAQVLTFEGSDSLRLVSFKSAPQSGSYSTRTISNLPCEDDGILLSCACSWIGFTGVSQVWNGIDTMNVLQVSNQVSIIHIHSSGYTLINETSSSRDLTYNYNFAGGEFHSSLIAVTLVSE